VLPPTPGHLQRSAARSRDPRRALEDPPDACSVRAARAVPWEGVFLTAAGPAQPLSSRAARRRRDRRDGTGMAAVKGCARIQLSHPCWYCRTHRPPRGAGWLTG
jgi:hypothetical protein